MSQDSARRAVAALRKGDHQTARALFEETIGSGTRDAGAYLGLAFACGNLGDNSATLSAVDRALVLEPHNLRALIFKADHLTRQQQTRRALAYYQAALKLAAQGADVPADIRAGLHRAEQTCQQLAGSYQSYLRQSLQQQGYVAGKSHPRFELALDIAFGKRQVYHQQPTRFHYPELPQIQFYPREGFPWMERLEAATDTIRDELRQVMGDADSFSPYLVSDADTVQFNDDSNVDNIDWGAYFFYEGGELVTEHAARCPSTMAMLRQMPLPEVPGNTPHALFSRLAGGARIPPHCGLINTRLICHLPLLVPENCGGLRCGNRVQGWREGSAYVFDDSIEHEAWNNSERERVLLLFDIWRPELNEEERQLISALLQSVHNYERDG